MRTQSLKVLPLKPGVDQYILPCIFRLLPGISSLLISTLPVHSPAFFQNLSQVFPVLAAANTGSCVGRQNKVGHLAGSRVECSRNINRLRKHMICDVMTCEMNDLEIE